MSATSREFPDWLSCRAAATPGRTALITGTRAWSFRELDDAATVIARQLAARGVGAGDRVATLLANGPLAAVLPHSTLRLGATLVPLNVRLSQHELTWQIRDCQARLLVAGSQTLDAALAATSELKEVVIVSAGLLDDIPGGAAAESDLSVRSLHAPEAVLAIIYTSGTTGRPKGVMLTVENFWWSAIGSAMNLGTHVDDRWLACLPLFHVGGLSILMRAAIYGIAAVVHERFDADAVNFAVDEQRVTIVSLVAVMLERMLDARGERPFPASLRCILLGGGPASPGLLERCARLGATVVQTYGLTETCSQVATLAPDEAMRRPGSSGKPLYPNEVRIASTVDAGNGEILVRGPVVMAGYAGQPEETDRCIVEGWLHTGDIGRLDEAGFLYVLDRRDDLIVTGGENVYPAEVEAVLASHESVAEAAVVGIPDATWGQRVVAIVRSRSAQSQPDSLGAWCRENLAGYKIPSEFRFVREALPRTASGKLRRAELRERAAQE